MRELVDHVTLVELEKFLRHALGDDTENITKLCTEICEVSVLQERHVAENRQHDDTDASVQELDERIESVIRRWGNPNNEDELVWLLRAGLRQAELGQATEWRAMLIKAAADLTAIQ